jgi:mxaJ protein
MFSRYRIAICSLTVVAVGLSECISAAEENSPSKLILRIAADPNNLPFSNERLEGFENKIAEVVAEELGAELRYTWRAQRRGFFRETLKSGDCDIVLGVPTGLERALTTEPYYRSSYLFVTRKDGGLRLSGMDDVQLRAARIGVQLIGDDGANTPPAHALAMRGIITNVVGYTVYGDYREANPPARIVSAVARGDIDVAIVWGPLAGYFAKRESIPLQISPIRPTGAGSPALPFWFDIGMGVKRGNQELKAKLDEALRTRRKEIGRILADFGVPEMARETQQARN